MNTQKAIAWLRLNDLPHIVVGIDSDRQPPTFSYEVKPEEEGDIEASISFFEQNIQLLPPGRYRIVAMRNSKGGSGKRMFRFTIGEEVAEPAQQNGLSSIGDINAHIEQIVSARISGFEMERKVLDLEKEKELLETALREKNSWQTQLSWLAERGAEHLVNKMGWGLPKADEEEPTQIPRPQPQIAEREDLPEGEPGEEDDELDNRHHAAIGCLCEKLETEGAVNLVEKISTLSPAALKRIQSLDPAILEKVAQIDDSMLSMIKSL